MKHIDDQCQLLDQGLQQYAKNVDARIRSKRVDAFLACKGSLYNRELMVVGRAVNGWADPASVEGLENKKSRMQLVENTKARSIGPEPMSWIGERWGAVDGGYNSKRSAFWRVAKGVFARITSNSKNTENWWSYLAWSNLYKISIAESDVPKQSAGNPTTLMCNAQLRICIELLNKEIEQFKPRKILFMTGREWANGFINLEDSHSKSPSRSKYIDAAGQASFGKHNCSYVLTPHPQTLNNQKVITAIVDSFRDT